MITVIVPIYNTEKYIRRCINSIINQTYKNLEIILVDDGSTDNSFNICKEYEKKDARIKYYKKKNEGQGEARNYGLERANGDWISFVDSDDWIKEDMYEDMIGISEKYEVDLIICGWYRDHGFKRIEQPCPKETQKYNNEELMKEYLCNNFITSSMCNKIYKKVLWDNIRFPKIRAREDAAILYQILAKSKYSIHIGKSKYIQYVRPGSTERQGFNKNKVEIINITKQIQKFIYNKYLDLYDYIALKPAKYCASLMQEILYSFRYKEYKKEYRKLYNSLKEELNLEYSNNIKNSSDYKQLIKILKHQNTFKIKSYLIGIKIFVVDFIKNVYMKLNRKGKV